MKKTEIERWIKLALLTLALAVCGAAIYGAGMAKGASGAVPGSAGDPLITKSYLDERLSELAGGSAGGMFSRVTLSRGDRISVKGGGELMVYSGNAEVTGSDGLVNLTTGELFRDGNSAIKYHLYLSPADDSGIRASGNVTVFVRGGYTKQ